MSVSAPTVEQLHDVDLFAELSPQQLAEWAQAATVRTLAPGEVLTEQGAHASGFHLVLEGSLEAIAIDGSGRREPLGEHRAPTWVGAIAVLTGGVSNVRMEALGGATIATIEPERFIALALAHRPVFDRIMRQIRPVFSRITALEQNRERLASLGTMAAGLAHELNNPAAAARRAASDLAEAVEVLGSTIGSFVEAGIERGEAEQLVALQQEALARCRARSALDAIDAADREEELLQALEEIGVEEPWRLAEPLVAATVDEDWLRRVSALAGQATDAAVRWVAASLSARNLAAELADSTERMSKLVAAVKTYAYMDRGELVEVDVHEGLETTLTVLAHKLKHTQIQVARDYDRELPRLTVRGGELNQVWTNLIDNAIQALGERGTITIATRRDGPCVRVDVGDDGPGIPAEVRERVFDPFFTTKDVGQGTGLGLDTVRRIVVERHQGSIDFDSEPGRTVFHVWLPLQASPTMKGMQEAA